MGRAFGQTGLRVSALGLGCSRIASLTTRASAREIAELLDLAYEGGIRVFDTADIYGQGDSERRLRRVAGRDGVTIVTKAGLRLKASQTLVRLAKPVLRPVLLRLRGARRQADQLRQESEDMDLRPAHLRASLEGSLRRLGRERVELFLLHSPPVEALSDGALYDLLDAFRDEGKALRCGVSCRSVEDADEVIASGRVAAVEVPLSAAALDRSEAMLDRAAAAGVGVIAREVFADLPPETRDPDLAIGPLVRDARIGTVLTGTTSAEHLRRNIAATRAALAGEGG